MKFFASGLNLMDVGLAEPYKQSLVSVHKCKFIFVSLVVSKQNKKNRFQLVLEMVTLRY